MSRRKRCVLVCLSVETLRQGADDALIIKSTVIPPLIELEPLFLDGWDEGGFGWLLRRRLVVVGGAGEHLDDLFERGGVRGNKSSRVWAIRVGSGNGHSYSNSNSNSN